MFCMRPVLLLGLAAVAEATCLGGQCASGVSDDGDSSALLQVKGACPPKDDAPVFGSPLSGYHNVTIWVYHQAMVELGFKVKKVVFAYEHAILYPMFLGKGGEDVCEAEGCPEYCAKAGLGYKSPCVDFVVDSNVPVNHATWLKPYTDQFDVMGTAFESQYIALFAPDYTGWQTMYDAANNPPNKSPKIYGWQSGSGDGCDTLYCPKCGTQGYITGAPFVAEGNTVNWTYEAFPCTDFKHEIGSRLKNREEFLVLMWTPQVFAEVFPQLVPLDMSPFWNKPNVGKAQVRKDSRHKFTDKALAVLGAVFIGSQGVKQMDAWSHGFNLSQGEYPYGGGSKGGSKGGKGSEGHHPLCPSESWDSNCALEAAELWIKRNKDHGKDQPPGVWPTFFW